MPSTTASRESRRQSSLTVTLETDSDGFLPNLEYIARRRRLRGCVVWSTRTSEYNLISFDDHQFLIVGSVLTARLVTYQKHFCASLYDLAHANSRAMQASGIPLRTAIILLVKSPIESHVYIEWSLD